MVEMISDMMMELNRAETREGMCLVIGVEEVGLGEY